MQNTPTPFTLRSRAGLPSQPALMSDSAVVIIDAQQEYSADGALPLTGYEAATAKIAELLAFGRAHAIPIVHVAHIGPSGGLFDPKVGGKLSVQPIEGEPVIQKTLPNSFAKTDLKSVIDSLGVINLVFAGFMTHMCVSSTARAALDLGYTTTVLNDATATRNLPGTAGRQPIEADQIHQAALAALADRFSVVTSTSALLACTSSMIESIERQ